MGVVRPKAIVQNLGIYFEYNGHCGRDWNKHVYSNLNFILLYFSFGSFEIGSVLGALTVLELSV